MKFFKTTIVLCFFALATIGAQAQQKSPFNTQKAIEASTDQMAADLGLNASQKQQVLNLNKDRQEKNKARMQEMKNSTQKTDKRSPQAAQQKAINDAKKAEKEYEQALRKILTPEQNKKLDERIKTKPGDKAK